MEHPDAREDPEALSAQLFDAVVMELKTSGFRPEFLGRVDECIPFLPFSKAICRQMVDGILKKELVMIKERKGVDVLVPDDVCGILAEWTFDKSRDEGARAASRTVNQHIINPVINLLLPYAERGENLPKSLHALLLGASDDFRGVKIEWEIIP